jgi:uncharacterized protein YeaO (DUF488 family)
MPNLKIKRVFDPPERSDGTRVLVDRLWPRGVTKEQAEIGVWLRDIAPTQELRKKFAHEAAKCDEFKTGYWHELEGNGASINRLRTLLNQGTLTLVFGAKNEIQNNAIALYEYLIHKKFVSLG